MNAVLYPLAALIAWSAAAYKFPSAIRRSREPNVLPLTVALAVLGIVFTISTPKVWAEIDHVAGWPNLSFLLSQVCVMIWTVIVQVLMLLWAYPPLDARRKVRIRLLIATGTVVVMATLFLLAPIQPEDSTDFAARFAGVPIISAYLCVYILAFAWMQGEIVYLCLRTIQVGGRIWLRRGLRTTAAGAVLGLVYCLVRASDVIFASTGLADPVRWEDIARLAVGIGVVLPPIGWTMPSWGPRLSGARLWAADVRNYWRLYPLWFIMHSTFADKDLDPPQGLATRIALRDLRDWRLPRRLALIWDCMLELQPYRDPGLERSMAELERRSDRRQLSRRATAEAEILLDALARYRQHLREGEPPVPTVAAATPSHESVDGEHLSTELGWLVAVSRAVRRHPARMHGTERAAEPSRAN
jgi:Family of unknown function (DUF6545)